MKPVRDLLKPFKTACRLSCEVDRPESDCLWYTELLVIIKNVDYITRLPRYKSEPLCCVGAEGLYGPQLGLLEHAFFEQRIA